MSNAPFTSTQNFTAATGVSNSPFTDQRAVIAGGGGGGGVGNLIFTPGVDPAVGTLTYNDPPVAINEITQTTTQIDTSLANLDVDYDQALGVLSLTDAALATPLISQTSIVPGRTVLIASVTTSNQGDQSILGMSNISTGVPLSSASLVGNNPPSVLIPASGISPWASGSTFSIKAMAKITTFNSGDELTIKVWSNRGQASAVVLNELVIELEDVNGAGTPFSGNGFSYTMSFTCRAPGASAVVATATTCSYKNTDGDLELFGDNNPSFGAIDTTIDQYLDVTASFNANGNTLRWDSAIITREY